MQELNNLV
jgi:hypothetical protein